MDRGQVHSLRLPRVGLRYWSDCTSMPVSSIIAIAVLWPPVFQNEVFFVLKPFSFLNCLAFYTGFDVFLLCLHSRPLVTRRKLAACWISVDEFRRYLLPSPRMHRMNIIGGWPLASMLAILICLSFVPDLILWVISAMLFTVYRDEDFLPFLPTQFYSILFSVLYRTDAANPSINIMWSHVVLRSSALAHCCSAPLGLYLSDPLEITTRIELHFFLFYVLFWSMYGSINHEASNVSWFRLPSRGILDAHGATGSSSLRSVFCLFLYTFCFPICTTKILFHQGVFCPSYAFFSIGKSFLCAPVAQTEVLRLQQSRKCTVRLIQCRVKAFLFC